MIPAVLAALLSAAAAAFLFALGAELNGDYFRFKRWAARKLLPASGTHVTGGQQRLPDLPEEAEPVLRDRMIADVRAEHDGLTQAEVWALGARRGEHPYPFRPSSAMDTGEFEALDARVEELTGPQRVQRQPWDTVHDMPPVPPLEPVRYRREDHAELDREFADRPGPEVLGRVRTALLAMPGEAGR